MTTTTNINNNGYYANVVNDGNGVNNSNIPTNVDIENAVLGERFGDPIPEGGGFGTGFGTGFEDSGGLSMSGNGPDDGLSMGPGLSMVPSDSRGSRKRQTRLLKHINRNLHEYYGLEDLWKEHDKLTYKADSDRKVFFHFLVVCCLGGLFMTAGTNIPLLLD